MLVDHEILSAIETGDIQISPPDSVLAHIQPSSLDVRLGSVFLTLDTRRLSYIDPKVDTSSYWTRHECEPGEYFTVHPGELVLAATLEHIGLGDTITARIEGKSSLGRLGLLVHATAGYIDPGWALAPITLEISTVIGVPVRLYVGMPIAHVAFERTSPVRTIYSGKYVGQSGPTASQYHRNWMGSGWS